jgi:hypothetical protein
MTLQSAPDIEHDNEDCFSLINCAWIDHNGKIVHEKL